MFECFVLVLLLNFKPLLLFLLRTSKTFNFIEHVCKGTCMAVPTWKSEHGLLVEVGSPILPCGFWVIELRSLALAVACEVILPAHRTFSHFFIFVWKSTQTKTHSLCCIRVNTYKTPLKLIKTEYFQSPPKDIPSPSLISALFPKTGICWFLQKPLFWCSLFLTLALPFELYKAN